MPKERDVLRARSRRVGCDVEKLVVYGVLYVSMYRNHTGNIRRNCLDSLYIHIYVVSLLYL